MKTLAELTSLPDDELRVMLAELAGFKRRKSDGTHQINVKFPDGEEWQPAMVWVNPEKEWDENWSPPNYPGDLDACHAVEVPLSDDQHDKFLRHLAELVGYQYWEHWDEWPNTGLRRVASATARQHTIALILTLQKP